MTDGWGPVGQDHVVTRRVTVPKDIGYAYALETSKLIKRDIDREMNRAQNRAAREVAKANRKQGLEARRALNRAQNVREKEAADLRRRAEAAPGTDRAPAMTRAFRAVKASRVA